MSVTLSPSSQLGFQRPLTQLVKRTLSVSNHSNSHPIAYKVKTTAPKQYCVRPNSGRIEPGETVEVQVLLQPMREDPPAGAKCRDKFLVQSVVITSEREGLGLPELWQSVEREDKSRPEGAATQIHEQKIRCTYLPAADSDAVSAIPEETSTRLARDASVAGAGDSSFSSAIGTHDTHPIPSSPSPPGSSTLPAYSTFTDSSATQQPRTVTPPSPSAANTTSTSTTTLGEKVQGAAAVAGSAAANAAVSVGLPGLGKAIDDATPSSSGGLASSSTPTPVSSSSSRSLGAGATNGAGESSEVASLRSQLSSAQAEISRLKAQLDAAETSAATLRSRGAGSKSDLVGGGGAGTSQAVVEMKGGEGVPVQVVVGVAFGVFVVTWLFF